MKRNLKQLLCAVTVGAMLLTACGTGASDSAGADASQEAAEEAAAETSNDGSTEETAAAAADTASSAEAAADGQAQEKTDGEESAVRKELLVVSFGTSYNDSRNITIGAIESALGEAFPDYRLRRAFTSQIIIDKLKERDGIEIDNVTEALERAVSDGVQILLVQPTHLMDGYEYTDLKDELAKYSDKIPQIMLGAPLLTDGADFRAVAETITAKTAAYDDGRTAIVFMGHGTEADSNAVYEKLQGQLTEGGFENYYIGTVEAEPSLEDVMAAMKEKKYRRVVLEPLMVVAGDHANNDMAGDEEDSWKSILEAEGYEVVCLLEGLGQIYDIQQLYVQHAQAVSDKLGAAEPKARVASASDYAGKEAVGSADMTPVTADQMADGTYEIEVESSSSMFKIVKCVLTVKDGKMSADMTLSGHGYSYLYMGTAEEAAAASASSYIGYTEDADGAYVYTVPVEALDTETDCAAYSKNKEMWYDRTLVFRSESV